MCPTPQRTSASFSSTSASRSLVPQLPRQIQCYLVVPLRLGMGIDRFGLLARLQRIGQRPLWLATSGEMPGQLRRSQLAPGRVSTAGSPRRPSRAGRLSGPLPGPPAPPRGSDHGRTHSSPLPLLHQQTRLTCQLQRLKRLRPVLDHSGWLP